MDYIIAKRAESKDPLYLIKWRGKQHHQNSWQTYQKIAELPGGQPLLDAFEANQKATQKKDKNKKKRVRKPKLSKQIVNLGKLKIIIPCNRKEKPHWIFGDQVEQVLDRNHSERKYLVRWKNGEESWESEQELLVKQGQKMCLFFQRQLNLTI